MSEYAEQAENFAKKYGVTMKVKYLKYDKYFTDDKESRHIFKITLIRNKEKYSFTFGQSIAEGGNEPKLYSVLTCLQKYDVGSFENFCDNFGYNFDSIRERNKVMKTYKAVCNEYENVERMFSDCIEELSEIY